MRQIQTQRNPAVHPLLYQQRVGRTAQLDARAQIDGGAGDVAELINNVGRTNLHYGTVKYVRLLGLKRPSN